tara:strand:- start:798 stop:2537 length:1740 start_codon:yes stop_codon:yes gene_type:complete
VIKIFFSLKKLGKNFIQILQNEDRKEFIIIITLLFIGAFFELLGLGLILPTLTILISENSGVYENFFKSNGINFINKDNIIYYFLSALIVVYFIKTVFMLFIKYKNYKFTFDLNKKISNRIYKSYFNKDFLFHVRNNSSVLVRNVLSETALFTTGFLQSLISLMIESLIIIFIFIFLIVAYPTITIILLLSFSLIVFTYVKIVRKKINYLANKRIKLEALRFQSVFQGFNGIKEILVQNKKDFFLESFFEKNLILNKINRKTGFLSQIPNLGLEFFTIIIFCSITIVLTNTTKDNDTLIIILGIYTAAIFKILPSISRIIVSLQSIIYSKPSIEILKDVLKDESFNQKINIEKIYLNQKIELVDIIFNFKKNQASELKIKRLIIPKNKTTGIFGNSGAGKSTIINILLGLIRPKKGAVIVDGNLVDNFEKFRNNLGYVPQDVYLLNDTVKANIAFGVEENQVDIERIKECCKLAKIDSFIEKLEFKYNSLIGERGLDVSGGEKQRLGIARALYHDPEILILDESTSALDEITELNILDDLNELKSKKTIIMITHKKKIIKKYCENVYRVEKGQVNILDE